MPEPIAAELNELRRRIDRLSSLIEVGAIISSTLDLAEVLRLVMAKAKAVMEAETCSVLLLNEERGELEFELTLGGTEAVGRTLKEKVRLKLGQGVAGWAAEQRQSVLVADAAADTRWFTRADELTGFTTRSLMAVPLVSKGRLIGVAEVMNPTAKPAFDQLDLELFETLCRQVAIALDNAQFHQAYLAQQRLKEQLAAAATIQRSFLPSPLDEKEAEPFRLKAVSWPALEVGGDLYDYFLLPGRRLAILLGDVSGKGVGAALFMARVVSEFRYLARLLVEPGAVIKSLNQSLCQGSELGMFVTAVYWLIDLGRGMVSYANAGHIPSLWRRTWRGEVELVETVAGPPLGIFDSGEYPASHLQLTPNDGLLMITDGIVEAWDKNSETLGYQRLQEIMAGLTPGESALEAVERALQAGAGDRPPHDDRTMLEVAWLGPSCDFNAQRPEENPDACPENDTVELDLSLGPRMMGVVRDVAGRLARLAGLDEEGVNGFKLAVDEACTNVLRHAYGGDVTRRLRLSFDLNPERLQARLHDFGLGFDPQAVAPPDLGGLKPGGLGVHLIKTVMDEVRYVHSPREGNTLTLIKKLA